MTPCSSSERVTFADSIGCVHAQTPVSLSSSTAGVRFSARSCVRRPSPRSFSCCKGPMTNIVLGHTRGWTRGLSFLNAAPAKNSTWARSS
ncbi:hypothetical protein PAXRUDRAFT_578807 [Paxillus rubicundulus Ve08.2h10]|uniref:Uncharacterized protein n=1 Tax=Paxillus rubicundulus Ve08.2h10 TaxID=930991 RepID=A0A0D0E4T6_9AGAM|nr:hypothetical protein PAXRUDRAFT_578807 [Paxillus rubicundulus Ve08.2h10]